MSYLRRLITQGPRQIILRYILQLKYRIAQNTRSLSCPPPRINFNTLFSSSKLSTYEKEFCSEEDENYVKFLAKTADLSDSSKVLDFGAGLGRHLLAFLRTGIPFRQFVAFEPNSQARAWLKELAVDNSRVIVAGEESVMNGFNYVDGYSTGFEGLSGNHGLNLSELFQIAHCGRFDLIHSSSVFTHMWPSSAKETLSCFAMISAGTAATHIDTWFIVDERASQALATGSADRVLPYRVNGVFTYSRTNPLVCTAYTESDMRELYEKSNLEIIEILWGSWRGGVSNGLSYMDIVISRPIRIGG